MKKSYTRISMAALAVLAASVSVTGCGSSKSSADKDNELYVYNWGEYIDESVISQFEEETGIKVIYDMFETNEEMYPIIEAGAISYDAVCPSGRVKLRQYPKHQGDRPVIPADGQHRFRSGKQICRSLHLG